MDRRAALLRNRRRASVAGDDATLGGAGGGRRSHADALRDIPPPVQILQSPGSARTQHISQLRPRRSCLRIALRCVDRMLGYVVKAEGGWPKLFPAIGVKSVFVLGGSGMVGSRIAAEARRRGHVVTRASRSAAPKPGCLLYTSPSPRDKRQSRMPSSA